MSVSAERKVENGPILVDDPRVISGEVFGDLKYLYDSDENRERYKKIAEEFKKERSEEYRKMLEGKKWDDESDTPSRKLAGLTLSRVENVNDLAAESKEEGMRRYDDLAKRKGDKRGIFAGEFYTHWNRNGLETKVTGKDGKIDPATLFSDLDSKAAMALWALAGVDVGELRMGPKGSMAEGKVAVDTSELDGSGSNFGKVKPDLAGEVSMDEQLNYEQTGWQDHHGKESGPDSSAAKRVYEDLVLDGKLQREPYLDKFVQFVTEIDNLSFSQTRDQYLESYKNLYGLGSFIPPDRLGNLIDFFKNGGDPRKELTEEEKKSLGITKTFQIEGKNGKKIPGGTLDNSLKRQDYIINSLSKLDELVKPGRGMVVETSGRYGKILVDIREKKEEINTIPEAAFACGYDTYLFWSPVTNSFILSSRYGFPENFSLSAGKRMRNMWISPESKKELNLPLKDVLYKLCEDKEFEPEGEIKRYINDEEVTTLLGEDISFPEERAEKYWQELGRFYSPVAVENMKRKMIRNIMAAAQSGQIVIGLDNEDGITEMDECRLAAYEMLPFEKEIGLSVGLFEVSDDGLTASALVEKTGESKIEEKDLENIDESVFDDSRIPFYFETGAIWVAARFDRGDNRLEVLRPKVEPDGVINWAKSTVVAIEIPFDAVCKVDTALGEGNTDPELIEFKNEYGAEYRAYLQDFVEIFRPREVVNYKIKNKNEIKKKVIAWARAKLEEVRSRSSEPPEDAPGGGEDAAEKLLDFVYGKGKGKEKLETAKARKSIRLEKLNDEKTGIKEPILAVPGDDDDVEEMIEQKGPGRKINRRTRTRVETDEEGKKKKGIPIVAKAEEEAPDEENVETAKSAVATPVYVEDSTNSIGGLLPDEAREKLAKITEEPELENPKPEDAVSGSDTPVPAQSETVDKGEIVYDNGKFLIHKDGKDIIVGPGTQRLQPSSQNGDEIYTVKSITPDEEEDGGYNIVYEEVGEEEPFTASEEEWLSFFTKTKEPESE